MEETQSKLKDIKDAVKAANLELALDELEKIKPDDDEITLLRGRLTKAKKSEISGTNENSTITYNKIATAILELVSQEKDNLIEEQKKIIEKNKLHIQIPKNETRLREIVSNALKDEYELICEIVGTQNPRSIIYKAKSLKQKNQYYAIKVYKIFSLIDDENRNELLYGIDDLQSAARHEGLINIIDTNITSFPWYIIMEYIEGASLEDYFKGAWKWRPDEILNILSSVCKSVWQCHQEAIVHGNLRPKNILLNKNEENKPIISSFTILKNSYYNKRNFETIIKSCQYLSPEEMSGEEPDEASDQFAIGLLGFELITGKPLYKGTSVIDLIDERKNHAQDSTYLLTKLQDYPTGISLIISKMLAKEKANRYEDLDQVIDEIRKITGKVKNEVENDRQLRQVKKSYDRCRKQHEFIQEFYTDFFKRCPAAVPKFKNKEKQYKMLDIAFNRLISMKNFRKGKLFNSKLNNLKSLHEEKKVTHHELFEFKKTLLEKIEKFDSKKWDEKLKKSWTSFLGVVITNLKEKEDNIDL